MLKLLSVAATSAVLSFSLAAPALAYDPCERATRDFRQADRAYTNYCGLKRGQAPYESYACARFGERGRELYNDVQLAYMIMARTCRY